MPPSPLPQERTDLYQAVNQRRAETRDGHGIALGRPRAGLLDVIRSHTIPLCLRLRRVPFPLGGKHPEECVAADPEGGPLLRSGPLTRAQAHKEELRCPARPDSRPLPSRASCLCCHGAFAHERGVETGKLEL